MLELSDLFFLKNNGRTLVYHNVVSDYHTLGMWYGREPEWALHPLSSVKSGYLPRCPCGIECLQNVYLLWAASEPGTGEAIPSDAR